MFDLVTAPKSNIRIQNESVLLNQNCRHVLAKKPGFSRKHHNPEVRQVTKYLL